MLFMLTNMSSLPRCVNGLADDEPKKLSQVNLAGPLTEQSISNSLSIVFKNNRCVFVSKSASHALLQLGDSHAIAMPLVPDQLMVQLRQQWAIILRSMAMCHVGCDA